jgi:VWFA-related protein
MRRVFGLLIATCMAGQEPRFDVQSRLVLAPVTVNDSHGRPVDNLEARDFVVLDNGRRREVSVDTFATGVAPIALVVAVQSSGISRAVLAKVVKIGAMIQPLVTGERGCAALVSFAEHIDWLQECTNNPDAIGRAFGRLRPGAEKSARMLDAVHEGIERLRKRSNARRVLLLISESRDRGSETALETISMDAQTAGVTIYAATYSAFKTAFTAKSPDYQARPSPTGAISNDRELERPPSQASPHIPPPEQRADLLGAFGELARLAKTKTTEVLAQSTGGIAFPFTRQKGLEDAIEKLGQELHTQYVLSFTPEAPEAGYHKLEVQVTRGGGSYRIRARPGYWTAQGVH